MKKAITIDAGKDWIDWSIIGFGMRLYVCWNREFSVPLGFVWGLNMGKAFNVFGSYVPRFARRLGVRTRMNAKILEHFQSVTTCGGSKDGGLQFLKASGYRCHIGAQVWWKENAKNPKSARRSAGKSRDTQNVSRAPRAVRVRKAKRIIPRP